MSVQNTHQAYTGILCTFFVALTCVACSDDTAVPLVSCMESVDCPRPQYCHYGNCLPLESIDGDDDGIPEEQEVLLGLDPSSADTDGDGKRDLDEVEYDPYSRVFGPVDRDGDGIPDGAESATEDSDNDGYNDEIDPCNDDPNCPTEGGQENDCSAVAGEVCVLGVGACEVLGVLACAEDSRNAVCTGVVIDGTEEVCDGVDNDCDGSIDEDFGNVGATCTPGIGLCRTEGTIICTGLFEARCSVTAESPTPERCDTQDNDCDGRIDEVFELGAPCQIGVDSCFREGMTICDADGEETRCMPLVVDDTPELCDDIDNDCDGLVDEGFEDLGTPCEEGSMACAQTGLFACNLQGDGLICSVDVLPPDTELCNAVDDDCDGRVDETFENLGTACSGGVGACAFAGVVGCDASGLETVCSASAPSGVAERCDAIDNDCDGSIDEDFQTLETTCSVGVGACARDGVYVCDAISGDVRCTARAGFAVSERCNGADDDCDGTTDEGFEGVGQPCERTQGSCRFAGTTQCRAIDSAIICVGDDAIDGEEICDGLDNDCDGISDEGLGLGSPCDVEEPNCARPGRLSCANDGTVFCSAEPLPGNLEQCDGNDNDCDGRTDEDFPLVGDLCSVGRGECTRFGVFECSLDGEGIACNAIAGQPSEDICDGLDNDCNGNADDGFPNVGNVCFEGAFSCAQEGRVVCSADGTSTLCNATARPATDELCNDADDDCDGNIDEAYPDKDGVCEIGVGECRTEGRWVCDASGLSVACQPDATRQPIQERCDDLDNDCDGQVDEDFTAGGCRRLAKGVSAAGFHTCMIAHDDQTLCFGDAPPSTPQRAASLLAGGGDDHCLIDIDKQIVCWGDGLGVPPTGRFSAVSVGRQADACALEIGTNLPFCWGDSPEVRSGPQTPLAAISVGENWACGLTVDEGRIVCWGQIPGNVPRPVDGGYTHIALGGRTACVLDDANQIQCFGNDNYGLITPPNGPYATFDIGPNSGCALTDSGAVTCWGLGSSARPHEGQGIPPNNIALSKLSVGAYHVCGIRSDMGIVCWGAGAPNQAPSAFNAGQASPP